MTNYEFSLKPFRSEKELNPRRVTGRVSEKDGRLNFNIKILGSLTGLAIPLHESAPERRNRLWEETCFEFFLVLPGDGRYWEFNLSPAGHWNVFCFEKYRQGMQEEAAVHCLPFSIRKDWNMVSLSLGFDLTLLIPLQTHFKMAVSSVLQEQTGQTTFWALSHPAANPDFHHRDSFLIVF